MASIDLKTVTDLYDKGISFNNSIRLNNTVNQNEDFYLGMQWRNIYAPDLPKPVLNCLARVVGFLVSVLVSDDISAKFISHEDVQVKEDTSITGITKLDSGKVLEEAVKHVFEDIGIETLNRKVVKEAAVAGDGCLYFWWDKDYQKKGGLSKGKIRAEIIHNTNVFVSDVTNSNIQEQDAIIIAIERDVEVVQKIAKSMGCANWKDIVPDQSLEKYAYKNAMPQDNITTMLHYFYKKPNGEVSLAICTKTIVISEEDTGYKLFPLAWLGWTDVKNCYHSQAVLTPYIQNQIEINRLMASMCKSIYDTAFPIVVYDSNKLVDGWTNAVGKNYAVVGETTNAVDIIRGADMSPQVLQVLDYLFAKTMEMMGVNDAAMGNVRPDNTSAIVVSQRAAEVPLTLQKQAFFAFVEEYVRVIIDIMRVKYSLKKVYVDGFSHAIKFSDIDYDSLDLTIEIGATGAYNEIAIMQNVQNLFTAGIVKDPILLLENIPEQLLPTKDKIIRQLKIYSEAGRPPNGEQPMATTGGIGAGQNISPSPNIDMPEQNVKAMLEQAIPTMTNSNRA